MIEVTRYVASDGKEFAKREECIEYERTVELRKAVRHIKAHCMVTYCADCPYYVKGECALIGKPPAQW